MRKTVQFLAVLMALLYNASAYAAVDPYEVVASFPAEGEVDSLQHFIITFGDLPVEVNENNIPTLENGGGATVQGYMTQGADGKSVIIDYDESFSASGQYFLDIPDNSLTVNGQALVPLRFRYFITGDSESFHEQISPFPAEGEVSSLQYFTISFPEYIGDVAYGSTATLRNDKSGRTYHTEMFAVGFNLLVYFPEEVTTSGNYTLTIPANSIEIYTLDFDIRELNFHYTIEGDDTDAFYDQISINPIQGNVLSLQNFTITFPENVDGITSGSKAMLTCTTNGTTYQLDMIASGHDVNINLPNEIVELGNYTLTIPQGSLIFNSLDEGITELNFCYSIKSIETSEFTVNPPEGEVYLLQSFTIDYFTNVGVNEDIHPILVNDDTGTAYECLLMEIGGKAFIWKEYPLSVLGNYTLHVPAACIEILENGTVNPEMTLHYTIVEKEYYVPPVIENQPAGELRLYERTGYVIREVEKEEEVPEGEWPYEIISIPQEGSMSVVFGADNKVYFQRPVSWSYYNGWVEGTLGADGKTITVPMGQYVAYTYSLEMAVQVAMFTYDPERNSYFYNPDIEELTYTLNDDGTITMNGTDEHNILGTMNRAFGQNFQYLDYEWLQDGDYASVYIPITKTPMTPPDDLNIETYYLNTAVNDGVEWEPYFSVVKVGFDGEDMWLQGITDLLPEAWIKGHVEGNAVTFENTQLLGAYEVLLYFKAADYNPVTGETTQKDMVMTFDDENTLYTYDYVFITTNKTSLNYIYIYQGLTVSKYPDPVVQVPNDLRIYEYNFKYKAKNDYGALVTQQHPVNVGFAGDRVYIQGIWEYLPDSWVEGQLVNGQLVFKLPQFIGTYDDEYDIAYPIYFMGFDQETGLVERYVTLDYNPSVHKFYNQSTALGFSINKTGYLNLQDIFDVELLPIQGFLTGDVDNDGKVSISDVTALINYLLSHNVSEINLAAADVDCDGKVNISDVTSIINLLLSPN